ncbi:MAG: hypothetical protein RBT34_12015 [Anaerolineaceae bacterium]|nr:hypothetical protein [Anaerolineaceae bacterium]
MTGYTIEELDKVLSKLLAAGVLNPIPEMQVGFSNIPQMTPCFQNAAAGDDESETTETLHLQLRELHVAPETASDLIDKYSSTLISRWIETYQEAVEVGLAQGSGFLVSALRRNFNIEEMRDRIKTHQRLLEKQTIADFIPVELKETLQKLGWEDDLEEIYQAHKQDPARTLAWAKHSASEGWGAGKFRKSLRSGLMPPHYEPVMRPPLAILIDADISSQDDWPEPSPEARNAWNDCMSMIAMMQEEDRGFNSGDLASWLEPATPISMECTGLDVCFTVRSCTSTAANWIETNARGVLEDVLGDILKQSVSLESVS